MDSDRLATGPAGEDIVHSLRLLMIERSLPLWSSEGWDPGAGGFVERLDRDGRADLAAPRRVRVQARQIYCFAKAAEMGWYPQGRDIAIKGLMYLLAKAKSPDGRPGFVHVLAPDGSTIDATRDTYDHAFVLLALAAIYRLTGDSQVLHEIGTLQAFIDRDLGASNGGFLEGIPGSSPRRQNPHMHLFEAFMAAFDATHDPVFQNRASNLYGLFIAHFFDEQRGVLGEFFADDWTWIEPAVVEPGHQAEWVWLLRGFEQMTGVSTRQLRSQLLATALRYRDQATGCLFDEGDAEGNTTRFMRRCWPQTEIAKAWIAQAESGEPTAADEARAALVRLHRHYLQHSVSGGWYDQFDGEGRSVVDVIPASSFYHVLCAIAEADRVLG